MARVKGMRLSDTDAGMTMDWTYARWISFDHAFGCNDSNSKSESARWGLGQVYFVLAASLILWSLVGFLLFFFLFFLLAVNLLGLLRRVGLREVSDVVRYVFLVEECQPWISIYF